MDFWLDLILLFLYNMSYSNYGNLIEKVWIAAIEDLDNLGHKN